MTRPGPRLALLGATGAVGEDLLELLAERSFPASGLRLFASEASTGVELPFGDEELEVEPATAAKLAGTDLVFSIAPGQLEPLLGALREQGVRIVDLTGALELDPEVPLFLPGRPVSGRELAVPRGVAMGLGLALAPLARECALLRVTVTTLESAAGAGRRGLAELQEQTLAVLKDMDGGDTPPEVFPRALAFDCLPLVGELGAADESHEEARLRAVLRRLLEAPELPIETTRIRVPVFLGALASVHVELEKAVPLARLGELWRDAPAVRLLSDPDLPTLRVATSHEQVDVGRVRADGSSVAFVLALDTLRRGGSLSALEAAAALLAAA